MRKIVHLSAGGFLCPFTRSKNFGTRTISWKSVPRKNLHILLLECFRICQKCCSVISEIIRVRLKYTAILVQVNILDSLHIELFKKNLIALLRLLITELNQQHILCFSTPVKIDIQIFIKVVYWIMMNMIFEWFANFKFRTVSRTT